MRIRSAAIAACVLAVAGAAGVALPAVMPPSASSIPPAAAPSAAQASAPMPDRAAAQLALGAPPVTKTGALTMLAALKTSAPSAMSGYSQAKFPHWRSAAANGWTGVPNKRCDARGAALYRDGANVTSTPACTNLRGSWLDPYTAVRVTSASGVAIDHLVPLAEAWRSGASSWTAARRTAYANDPLELVSAKTSVNSAKGDKDPAAWKPPNQAAWCGYAKRWVQVKTKYGLTADPAEKTALAAMLARC